MVACMSQDSSSVQVMGGGRGSVGRVGAAGRGPPGHRL